MLKNPGKKSNNSNDIIPYVYEKSQYKSLLCIKHKDNKDNLSKI